MREHHKTSQNYTLWSSATESNDLGNFGKLSWLSLLSLLTDFFSALRVLQLRHRGPSSGAAAWSSSVFPSQHAAPEERKPPLESNMAGEIRYKWLLYAIYGKYNSEQNGGFPLPCLTIRWVLLHGAPCSQNTLENTWHAVSNWKQALCPLESLQRCLLLVATRGS